MTRFFTADPHYGHERIIEYSHRPFDDVEDMNAGLAEAWNAVVGHDDTVWLLGDVAMGRLMDSLEWLRLLNGHIVLVPGNHEACAIYKKGARANGLYLGVGVKLIVPGPTALFLEPGDRHVLIDHFPYRGDPDERYHDERPVNQGAFLLHGHVHDRWRQRGRMINVGVDAWAGRPVSEAEVVALIDAGPNDLERLPWTRP